MATQDQLNIKESRYSAREQPRGEADVYARDVDGPLTGTAAPALSRQAIPPRVPLPDLRDRTVRAVSTPKPPNRRWPVVLGMLAVLLVGGVALAAAGTMYMLGQDGVTHPTAEAGE